VVADLLRAFLVCLPSELSKKRTLSWANSRVLTCDVKEKKGCCLGINVVIYLGRCRSVPKYN